MVGKRAVCYKIGRTGPARLWDLVLELWLFPMLASLPTDVSLDAQRSHTDPSAHLVHNALSCETQGGGCVLVTPQV